jgi:hypothetical protein
MVTRPHLQKIRVRLFPFSSQLGINVGPLRGTAHSIRRLRGALVKYLPPFELIRRSIEISTVRGELRVNMSYEDFVKILRTMIAGIDVDEAWYLRTYEDIASAIKGGGVKSARQHFVDDGYFEGRRPFAMTIDERWYLTENPDVADSIRRGDIPSAQEHFDQDGYREGRLPFGM